MLAGLTRLAGVSRETGPELHQGKNKVNISQRRTLRESETYIWNIMKNSDIIKVGVGNMKTFRVCHNMP
ncbi:hypothetical protein CA284_18680 [Enterobacter mori]|uniref:hypothetical protein n=1 Tax=Enterobacter ludwigii TaxID=299767 RepID=UPI000B7F19B2|nr:hypothetical protein [Enterobacter ludwigii]OXL38530.1 hypothetical protein CA284_18680 [Enterobacter mori]